MSPRHFFERWESGASREGESLWKFIQYDKRYFPPNWKPSTWPKLKPEYSRSYLPWEVSNKLKVPRMGGRIKITFPTELSVRILYSRDFYSWHNYIKIIWKIARICRSWFTYSYRVAISIEKRASCDSDGHNFATRKSGCRAHLSRRGHTITLQSSPTFFDKNVFRDELLLPPVVIYLICDWCPLVASRFRISSRIFLLRPI